MILDIILISCMICLVNNEMLQKQETGPIKVDFDTCLKKGALTFVSRRSEYYGKVNPGTVWM